MGGASGWGHDGGLPMTTDEFIRSFRIKKTSIFGLWKDLSKTPEGQNPSDDCQSFAWTVLILETGSKAKALLALHDLAGCSEGFRKIYVRPEGVSYRLPMTPQILKFAEAPQSADWVTLTRQQAGAWHHCPRS